MISRPSHSHQTLLVGTRGSALALTQSELAKVRFQATFADWDVAISVISTEGDRDKQSPLTEIGGRGVFTNALEAAVLAGQVDAAVHSAKDLPTTLHPDAPIVAFPERASPHDVLVSRHDAPLDHLPSNPRIGTSSRRRAVQIKRLRPDARIVELRGNIDTRLRKSDSTELDGIVVAAAGLERMGWSDRIVQRFSVEEVIPSPAQGALAIQARRDSLAASMLARIDAPGVSSSVIIERAFLAALGAGCTWPVGAYVTEGSAGFHLTAMLANETGERVVHASECLFSGAEMAHAAEIASRLWSKLNTGPSGATRRRAPQVDGALAGARVLVTRPRRQAEPLIAALEARGAATILLPAISIELVSDTSALDCGLREVESGAYDWLVFTSVNAVKSLVARMRTLGLGNAPGTDLKVAVVGKATAAAIVAAGFPSPLVPDVQTAEALAAALIQTSQPGARVLYPRSAIGRDALPVALRKAGMEVVCVEAYETCLESDLDPDACEQVRSGGIDLLTFSSPSSVHGFIRLMGAHAVGVMHVPCLCAGPITANAAEAAGFMVVHIAGDAGADAMAVAAARIWQRRESKDEVVGEEGAAVVGSGSAAIGRSGD